MKKPTLTLALTAGLLALSACTGENTSTPTPTPSAPTVTSTAAHPSITNYANLTPSSLGKTATPFDVLPTPVQEDLKAKAKEQGRPFLIWGAEVIWVSHTVQINAPKEHVQYITEAVAHYANTPTPVYFVSGVGSEQGPTLYLYAGPEATSGHEVTYQQYLYMSGLA